MASRDASTFSGRVGRLYCSICSRVTARISQVIIRFWRVTLDTLDRRANDVAALVVVVAQEIKNRGLVGFRDRGGTFVEKRLARIATYHRQRYVIGGGLLVD